MKKCSEENLLSMICDYEQGVSVFVLAKLYAIDIVQFYLGEIKEENEHTQIKQSMSRKGNCLDNAIM